MSQRPIQCGDHVLVVHATYHDEWIGTIAIVTASFGLHRNAICLRTLKKHEVQGYILRLGNGAKVVAAPWQIRRLDDDESTVTEQETMEGENPSFVGG